MQNIGGYLSSAGFLSQLAALISAILSALFGGFFTNLFTGPSV